jgi:tRNA A37 methylthiotransferase MiaB
MKGRIKTEIAKQRSRFLTYLCSDISYIQNKRHVGKKYNVLITEKGKNNTSVSRSDNYKPVVINENVDLGSFMNVKIVKAAPTYLVGSII